jgi:hypothetical protein
MMWIEWPIMVYALAAVFGQCDQRFSDGVADRLSQSFRTPLFWCCPGAPARPWTQCCPASCTTPAAATPCLYKSSTHLALTSVVATLFLVPPKAESQTSSS